MPDYRAVGALAHVQRSSSIASAPDEDTVFAIRPPHSVSTNPNTPTGYEDSPRSVASEQGLLAATHTPGMFCLGTIKPFKDVNHISTHGAPPPSGALSTPTHIPVPMSCSMKAESLVEELRELALESLRAAGNHSPSLAQLHAAELQVVGRMDRDRRPRSNTVSSIESQSSSDSILLPSDSAFIIPSESELNAAELGSASVLDGSDPLSKDPTYDSDTSSEACHGRLESSPDVEKSQPSSPKPGRSEAASTFGRPDRKNRPAADSTSYATNSQASSNGRTKSSSKVENPPALRFESAFTLRLPGRSRRTTADSALHGSTASESWFSRPISPLETEKHPNSAPNPGHHAAGFTFGLYDQSLVPHLRGGAEHDALDSEYEFVSSSCDQDEFETSSDGDWVLITDTSSENGVFL
ncbi:hypothetical protein K490DRAFT_56929 [Saccharata proteae CBS 121410]|uniref:Uncharacterized protein n=1 Tax=Saccharata proteae CBS 121410 TaxID=1314787 RepID=A0A9P4HSR0_9PEZI|nr:hypothetical protein K490DRAFT_56929 [Saccharata proteae CBS 121410]